MNTFSIRDLRDRTGELVRTAEDGQLSVVTKHGQPVFVAVPFDEKLLELGVGAGLAVKLYQSEVMTMREAAKLADMSMEEFMDCLREAGVPVLDYDEEELSEELRGFL